jgi:hypothetical protein
MMNMHKANFIKMIQTKWELYSNKYKLIDRKSNLKSNNL